MSVFGMFEKRDSLENPAVPLTSASLLDLFGGAKTDAGVPVSEASSLQTPAVWRCVGLIAGVSAALPLHSYVDDTRDRTKTKLLKDPHPELTPLEVWRLAFGARVLWGDGYLQKVRDRSGNVAQLWPVHPSRVRPFRVRPSEEVPGGKLFDVTDDWGAQRVLSSRDILHMPGFGYDGIQGCSPVRLAAQGISLAQAAERSAGALFGRGNLLGGLITTKSKLNDGQAASLKARWEAGASGVSNAQRVAVLDSDASFTPVTMPNSDAQFLESRQFQVVEIARMFGVPPFLLMSTEKSTSWGTGLEQQVQGWVTFDLGPQWLQPAEQRITKELLPPNEYAKYALQGLLRGDSSSRATYYRAMRDIGAYCADDIRALEDLPPIPGGDGQGFLQPTYMAPLGSDPLAPKEPAASDNAARAAALIAEARRLLETPDHPTTEGEDDED
ncbi:phage portal protein [Streptomyces sp. NPDC008141]|uniref:phage portal protein n=1 Tax=Streptomyces sp. NPDC008141 TaxID=3364815 RepID=UPI0036ED7E4C